MIRMMSFQMMPVCGIFRYPHAQPKIVLSLAAQALAVVPAQGHCRYPIPFLTHPPKILLPMPPEQLA